MGDALVVDASGDQLVAYTQIRSEIEQFGFRAEVDAFPGGTFGLIIHMDSRDLLLRGVEDGKLVLMDETDAALVEDAERVELSLAECIARAIVNRINVDDLPQPKE